MSNPEINRQIVQAGLDRRAAKLRDARDDARHDAAERALREKINAHCRSRRLEVSAAGEVQRREEERNALGNTEAEARRRKRKANQEAAYCSNWYRLLILTFAPLFFASVLLSLTNLGVLPIALTAPFVMVACLIGIKAFADRFIPYQKQANY